jgi:hypothetical protein
MHLVDPALDRIVEDEPLDQHVLGLPEAVDPAGSLNFGL